ncbi:MAG: transposase [Parvularculaceae bacterium]|nr:transposase [Parvularculaceae bacterium]
MARLARFIVPDAPHHVTQRGNGRQRTFFCEVDYLLYRDLLKEHCTRAGVSVWAWVLMPNHVHLILTPSDTDGLRAALSRVHRAYAGHVHAREKRTGHFWQGRFGCVAMDEAHLAAAVPYVALNPVRARLVQQADDWRWSSVRAHLDPARGDGLTDPAPVAARFGDFAAVLRAGEDEAASIALRRAETIGRPLGGPEFHKRVETALGRSAAPKRRGRKTELSALSP